VDYNQLKALIPKDKFDFTPFKTLMEISEDKVQPILSKLLFWVADMNWPIATTMVDVLARFPDSVVPLIEELLKPTEMDEEWKYSAIIGLIPALPADSQKLLEKSIKRILDSPTDGEIHEGVLEAIKDYAGA